MAIPLISFGVLPLPTEGIQLGGAFGLSFGVLDVPTEGAQIQITEQTPLYFGVRPKPTEGIQLPTMQFYSPVWDGIEGAQLPELSFGTDRTFPHTYRKSSAAAFILGLY